MTTNIYDERGNEMYTLQPGCKVTYLDVDNQQWIGLVTEMSSDVTCEVSWFKPEKVRGTEWRDNLLVLARTVDMNDW